MDVSPELDQVLEEIARQEQTTKADVLRRSIALMQVAVKAKRQGLKFGATDQDQVLKTEIVGI
ncbi:DNA-binding protein [Gloeobacter morelensis MG652769]|uniref:DNA-binding protein n=1 Tax=Gloeobacter morelensis MG652769 TaxID=2781736 RepID=A0ABY3PTJ8_9CYAN|nr:DNA-binding protein [Gloeobacter morelensis MG652769]